MGRRPEKFCDLIGCEFVGFRITEAYWLKSDTVAMSGVFPAIVAETHEMIICLDTALLEKIARLLPQKRHSQEKMMALVNEEENYGFGIANGISLESRSFRMFSEEDFIRYTRLPNQFIWAK